MTLVSSAAFHLNVLVNFQNVSYSKILRFEILTTMFKKCNICCSSEGAKFWFCTLSFVRGGGGLNQVKIDYDNVIPERHRCWSDSTIYQN